MNKKIKHALLAAALAGAGLVDFIGGGISATGTVGLIVNLVWLAEV